tara:strand:+ start:1998 stop:3512 length:1515 start_codon:yes stop_codon:yes gene_type:complete
MSTLSDLLPAGSGGKQVDFIADGAINKGQTVALKTDGKVEPISSTSFNNEFQNQFLTNNLGSGYTNTRNIAPVWDSSAGKLVAAALGGGNVKIWVATESGTIGSTYSLSYGTPVNVNSGYTAGSLQGLAYHVTGERVVIMVTDASYQNLYAYPVEIASNGTITVGTASSVAFGSNLEDGKLIYDTVNNKVVAIYRNNGVSKYSVMSVSGGSLTVNYTANIGIGTVTDTDLKYLQQTGQVGLAYLDSSNSSYPMALIGTVSGNTVSWGTAKQVASTGETPRIAQDNNGQIGFFIARVGGTNQPTEGYAGTLSGNNVTFGTGVDIYNPNGEERLGAYFDTNAKQFVVAADSDTSTYAKVWLATISGSTLSWVQNQYNMRGNSGNLFIRSTCGFFAPEAASGTGTGFFYWLDDGGGPYLGVSYARPAYTINLNENFIGIADAAISDTATGSVTIKGGIATNASLPTLTPNSVYYVQGDGTISTTSTSPAVRLGKALSSTSINLEFNS